MSKKTSLALVTAPHNITVEAGRFMPRQSLEQLNFWEDLKERERSVILDHAKQLSAAMIMHGSSGLAVGAHLASVQAVLRPHRKAFAKFLRNFRFTERTAYRYIIAYQNAAERLSEPMLNAAMARGMSILGYSKDRPLGNYTEAYEIMKPLPRVSDHKEANRVLDQLESTRKQINSDPKRKAAAERRQEKKRAANMEDEVRADPDFLLKQSYRAVKNSLRHVSSRKRMPWMESLVGMLLTEMNISNSKSFKPEAIPDDFRQGRGRPRLEAAAAASAAS